MTIHTRPPLPESGERVSSRDQMLSRGPMGMMPALASSKDAAGTLRRLLRRVAHERIRITAVLVMTVAGVCLTVYGPKLLGQATDVLVNGLTSRRGVDFGHLSRIVLLAAGIFAAGAFLTWAAAYVVAGVVQRAMFGLRRDVEEKLHRLPLSYVDHTPRGDLMSRVTNDIDNIAQTLQMTASQIINAILTVVGITVMMFWIDPILAVVALVTVPISMVLVRALMSRSKPRFMDQWAHTGRLNAQVEEAFTGHLVVRAFGQEDQVEDRFAQTNIELYSSSFKAQFLTGLVMPAMLFLGNLNYVAVVVVGGLRVAGGAMTIGQIQAFIQYSRQFTQPLAQIGGQMNMVQSGLASAERVFELLDAAEESAEPPAVAPAPTVGRVEFHHVDFSYSPDEPLIQDLSLVAEPGQTVAIVGPTGAGKTTLVNLIMRFYEIDGGEITVDGVDIRSLSRQAVRSKVGMVLQDTWLFHGTIFENIAYGNLKATPEEVLEAARLARVDHFVHTLPESYDTMIDEDGGNLSAGQRQLLTIARAFLSDPSILILDEATSSVDTRTEVLVQEAMEALRSRRTSFVIAHRLSTIRDADHILMMQNGRIVEQGSHDELLARRGAYFELYDSQFRAAVADVDSVEPVPAALGSGGSPVRGAMSMGL